MKFLTWLYSLRHRLYELVLLLFKVNFFPLKNILNGWKLTTRCFSKFDSLRDNLEATFTDLFRVPYNKLILRHQKEKLNIYLKNCVNTHTHTRKRVHFNATKMPIQWMISSLQNSTESHFFIVKKTEPFQISISYIKKKTVQTKMLTIFDYQPVDFSWYWWQFVTNWCVQIRSSIRVIVCCGVQNNAMHAKASW